MASNRVSGTTHTPEAEPIARRISIRGTTQGVGFRPFFFRVATRWRLNGWVYNGVGGVEAHVEGADGDVQAFVSELQHDAPAAAVIAQFLVRDAALERCDSFQIRDSDTTGVPTTRIPPDLAICDDCLRELRDPADRRYRYPYINCVNCGPRYSILRALPYDRVNTTLAAWPLCPACRSDYESPLDRRFHAQPVACHVCGPRYRLIDSGGGELLGADPIERAAERLRSGAILAVKGIGGYHLAVDATNPAAVRSLRERKFRKEKAFAVMVRDLNEARRWACLTPEHERLLVAPARPIVLADNRQHLEGVAPESATIGLMLPYAPLHYLLFDAGCPSPLVLTSGNRSSEPIAYRDDVALEQLTGIADALLVGERPIARRVDDSVASVRDGRATMIRRARGSAPAVVGNLPGKRPILALGSDLKNTITLVVDGQAIVSQHIGDLDDCESQQAFQETVADLLAMYDLNHGDVLLAHDLHPQFATTRFALGFHSAGRIAVQHHEAHVASVLAEHELLEERVLGVVFDGTGYGRDGTIWGGEFLVGSVASGFERCASLRPTRLPGGDAAARYPVQAAAAFLAALPNLPDMSRPPFDFPPRFDRALALISKNVRSFESTSVGRLFDAVAALLGFTREPSFEGQAALWLEHQARQSAPQTPYPCPQLDYGPLIKAIVDDRLAGRGRAEIAAAFHAALAAGTVEQIHRLTRQHKLATVALSGGVFQNELLFADITRQARQIAGLRLVSNERVPVNDGGVSLGQAAMAALASW
jgi:hydrogenase maturation protein HypF